MRELKKKEAKDLILKSFSQILILGGLLVILYLVFLPVYPKLKSYLQLFRHQRSVQKIDNIFQGQDDPLSLEQTNKQGVLGQSLKVKNRIIIPLINVNTPLSESQNSATGLSQGAWLLPQGSRPGRRGNTIITAHRFKYLPPHNLTFYFLDKLEPGDRIMVYYQEEKYVYQVKRSFLVEAEDLSILKPSEEEKLTLFTCHPVFSEKQRLVVVAEPVQNKS